MKFLKPVTFLSFLAFVIMLGFSSLTGCQYSSFGSNRDSILLVTNQVDVYYDMHAPEKKYYLPYILAEISGLTFLEPNKLLAVQDEDGKVFEFDLDKEQVISGVRFEKPNDYEGLELIGDMVYVLESDGDIHYFKYTTENKTHAKKKETPLSSDNDAEGLGYDPETNRLLIACKGSADLKDDKVEGKAVYAVDLKDMDFKKKPFLQIRKRDLEAFYEANKNRDYERERFLFKPSAIAYNPIDQYFYVVASVGRLMLVMDRKNNIKAAYPLPSVVMDQPEGICFAPNGDMYISSEGGGERGYILKFVAKHK